VPEAAATTSADDERRHRPAAGSTDWQESWSFDLWTADASLGAFVTLTFVPALATAWYWVAVVGTGRTLVALRDHEVPLPGGSALEVRAPGLWSDLTCETPLDHWSVGLEAFAVAYDDPLEAWRSERGDPTALGLDLEWEADGPADALPADAGPNAGPDARTGQKRYRQACRVHGDVLVGAERLAIEAYGSRSHQWGERHWWGPSWAEAWGRLDNGSTFASAPHDTAFSSDGLPQSATVDVEGGSAELIAAAQAPVLVPAVDGRNSRLARALCRYRTADGRTGAGWAEWLHPATGK
jgi:hypothetical protein